MDAFAAAQQSFERDFRLHMYINAINIHLNLSASMQLRTPHTCLKHRSQKEKKSRPVSRVLSLDSHSSRPYVAARLKQPTRERRGPRHAPLCGLAPGGVCHATRRCPRARCALTAPFHHHHARLATPFGCLFSVALSVGSRRPGVTWHLALRSPDFPRPHPVAGMKPRLSGRLRAHCIA